MKSNIEHKAAPDPAGEQWTRPFGQPLFTWWADQAAQAYRFATFASLLPGVATLRHLHRFYAGVLPGETPQAAPDRPDNASAGPRNDLEELREAWQEFEETKGDWSKSR
jgi:hypothetical protein